MSVVRIENWAVVVIGENPWIPPEAQDRGLHGNVYGHPDFPEGESVTTSRIDSAREVGEEAFVHTASGREYRLGAIDQEWERRYPNARQRFLNFMPRSIK